MECLFENLPIELLIHIFEYCDIFSLFVLQTTCKRFYKIITESTNLNGNNPFVVTNQLQQDICNRSVNLLTLKEKYRISNNWIKGIYKEKSVLKEKKRHMPHLILTKTHLLLSKDNCVYAYKRTKDLIKVESPNYSVSSQNTSDICKFVFKGDYLVGGQRDGSIFLWNSQIISEKASNCHIEIKSDKIFNCHKADVHSVDLKNNILITGSKDQQIKLWCLEKLSLLKYTPIFTYNMNDRVWSTTLSNQLDLLAVGTAGYNSVPPLHIFDLNKQDILLKLSKSNREGLGILQMKWETPHTLLSVGYDKSLNKWDLRTGTCEQSWEDPFFTTMYCLETDNYCTILTGSQNHGRIVLWDVRKTNFVQLYFVNSGKKPNFKSPIYSLSFDASCLYAAADCYLSILNFSIKKGVSKTYAY